MDHRAESEWKVSLRSPSKAPHWTPLVSDLRRANENAIAEADGLRQSLATSQAEVGALQVEIERTTRLLESRALRAEQAASANALDAVPLRQMLEAMETDVSQLVAQLDAARAEVASLKAELERADAATAAARADKVHADCLARDGIARLRSEFEAREEDLRKELNRTREENASLQALQARADGATKLVAGQFEAVIGLLGLRAARGTSRLALQEGSERWRDFLARRRLTHRATLFRRRRALKLAWLSFSLCTQASVRGARVRNCIVHMRHRSLTRGWESWLDVHREQTALRVAARAIVTRWLKQGLTRGWCSWLSMWHEQTALRDAASAIVTRWLKQGLTRGWCSWVSVVEEREQALRRLRSAAARMVHRRLAAGFSTWRDNALADMVSTKMQRAIMRLVERELCHAWTSWVDHSRHLKALMVRRREAQLERKRRQREDGETIRLLLGELEHSDSQLHDALFYIFLHGVRARCTDSKDMELTAAARDLPGKEWAALAARVHRSAPSSPTVRAGAMNRGPNMATLNRTPLRSKTALTQALRGAHTPPGSPTVASMTSWGGSMPQSDTLSLRTENAGDDSERMPEKATTRPGKREDTLDSRLDDLLTAQMYSPAAVSSHLLPHSNSASPSRPTRTAVRSGRDGWLKSRRPSMVVPQQ
jgi:hypothetical protein